MNQDQVEKVDTRLIALFSRKDLYHLSIKVCLKPPTNQPLSLSFGATKVYYSQKTKEKSLLQKHPGLRTGQRQNVLPDDVHDMLTITRSTAMLHHMLDHLKGVGLWVHYASLQPHALQT